MEQAQLLRQLMRMRKAQALEGLQKLSEESLNAFAGFLDSDEAEEILCELSMLVLALRDCPKSPKTQKRTAASRKRGHKTKIAKIAKIPKAPKAPKQQRTPKTEQRRAARAGKTVLRGIRNRDYGFLVGRFKYMFCCFFIFVSFGFMVYHLICHCYSFAYTYLGIAGWMIPNTPSKVLSFLSVGHFPVQRLQSQRTVCKQSGCGH